MPRSPMPGTKQPTVALCMIVKNEQANLPQSLGSVVDLVDEAIVVDTGSTDATRQVAAELGARVFDYPWSDSFSAARNQTLRHAASDWIFWLDADDRVDEENRRKLQSLFAALSDEVAGYLMRVLLLPGPSESARTVEHLRLFRRHPDLRWKYRVHEQVTPSLLRAGGHVHKTDVVIQHAGYTSIEVSREKVRRNVRLLLLDHQDSPRDPCPLFYLGRNLMRTGQTREALQHLYQALQLAVADDVFVPRIYSLIATGHQRLGQLHEMRAILLAGLTRYPDFGELVFLAAGLSADFGDKAAAEAGLRRLLQPPTDPNNVGDDPSVHGFKSRHHLAVICKEQGRRDEAESLWIEALRMTPDFPLGWLGLGQLYLEQERWADVEQAIRRCEGCQNGAVEATTLRALLSAKRGDLGTARLALEEAIGSYPQSVELRMALSQVLLKQNDDPEALRRALESVLELNPLNAAVRNQLERLGPRSGRPS